MTATSCAPTAPAGVTAVILVAETTTTDVAAAPPTDTLLGLEKFVPEIVIAVPPIVDPDVGLTLSIVGAGFVYVNARGSDAVPTGVVTATVCAPTVPAAVTAAISVADTTRNVATAPPTLTLLASNKFVPVIVMAVPPRVGPDVGLTLSIVG